MPSHLVHSDRSGPVMTITLADEEHRNSLGGQLTTELMDACDAADANSSVRVVVLTNIGQVFCAGANLAEQSSSGPYGGNHTAPDPMALFARFRRSPKPYVGRIAGHCVAGGMGLVAAMDISIAVDDVKLGFTEVRVGVAPAVVSVMCLPKMRLADAQAAFLRGTRFSAAEAVLMGLLNAAVPADRLDAEVGTVVDDLLAGGPEAIAAAKQLILKIPGMPIEEAFEWTGSLSKSLFQSDEAQEGMRAFLEKRPPRWTRD